MTATGAMRCGVIMKGIGFRMPQEAPIPKSNEIPGQTPQKKRVPISGNQFGRKPTPHGLTILYSDRPGFPPGGQITPCPEQPTLHGPH